MSKNRPPIRLRDQLVSQTHSRSWARTSLPRVPAATSPEACLHDACPADARPPCLASSHGSAIRATATAESGPKRAFSQPFPRSCFAEQLTLSSCHTTRRVTTRSVSLLSTLHPQPLQHRRSTSHLPGHGLGLKRTRQSTLAARQHDNTSQRACQRSPAYANTTARAPAHGSRQQDSASQPSAQYSTRHSATLIAVPHHTPDTRPTPLAGASQCCWRSSP